MGEKVIIERIGRQKRDLARFFDVADRIYRDDRNRVAPLRHDLAKVLSSENPFFRHAEMQLFLARKEGRDAGRIAAILDRHHNEFHVEKTAFFGFFEGEEDPMVSAALFEATSLWARERKMSILRGPANPSFNDEAGLLVEGFDSPPVFMMTYNPRYYPQLVEAAGFRKAKDLYAFWFEILPKPLERFERLAERVRRTEKEVLVRTVSKRSLEADLPRIREVYNAAWEKNWGFVPMTLEEIEFSAKRLKPLLAEDFCFLAEVRQPDGALEPIAFMLSLPDYNAAIGKTRGKLFPFGWLRFWLAARKIRTIRVITLGIKEKYRMRGILPIMFYSGLRSALRRGYTGCEVSWLLEENLMVQRAAEIFGGHRYKTYRLYDRAL